MTSTVTCPPPRQCRPTVWCSLADSPVDREAVAKNVYLELINQAQRRLQICTPYLILDNDLLACLRLAAARCGCAHLHARLCPTSRRSTS